MITATATLTETISVTASLGGSVCLAATYTLVDTDVPANTLDSGSIASGAAATIVAPAATITVNTAPFGTALSGGGLNVPVVSEDLTNAGTIIAGKVVIANTDVSINTVPSDSLQSEEPYDLTVTLGGNPTTPSYNAGTRTIDVTPVACADATITQNGAIPLGTVASGADFPLTTKVDGVTVNGSYDLPSKTLSFTSNTGWQPDPNWPVLPSLTAADERFVGTLAVFENNYNIAIVRAPNLAANINWGDGTSVVSNGANQTKVYDYATIAATVYTFQGRNVKYVTVDITRVGGAITSLTMYDATTVNALGGNNYLDIICSLPNSTVGIAFTGYATGGNKPMTLLQRLRVKAIGAGAGAFYQGLCRGMESLRVLEWPYNILGQHQGFSTLSGQVDDLGNIDWGLNTTQTDAFAGSKAKRHGNMIANSATTALASYAASMPLLEEFGTITATSATTLVNFFGGTTGCPVLFRVGLITAPACQNLSGFAFRCYSLGELTFSDCAAVTSTTNMVTTCPSLFNLVMPNLTRGVNMASSAMSNYGMNNFANSIGTAAGAQTITVTGTPFGALLTALDATALAIRLVMTGKGYTVAN